MLRYIICIVSYVYCVKCRKCLASTICMTKHSYFPYTSIYISTRHNINRKRNIHHIPNTNIQHTYTPRLKQSYIFNNCRYISNISTDHHTVTTTDIKNMHHIHTSIFSRHLATRGNNKILRTPPPPISSSKEIIHLHHSSHPCPPQNN